VRKRYLKGDQNPRREDIEAQPELLVEHDSKGAATKYITQPIVTEIYTNDHVSLFLLLINFNLQYDYLFNNGPLPDNCDGAASEDDDEAPEDEKKDEGPKTRKGKQAKKEIIKPKASQFYRLKPPPIREGA
jgi:hypothetical protein